LRETGDTGTRACRQTSRIDASRNMNPCNDIRVSVRVSCWFLKMACALSYALTHTHACIQFAVRAPEKCFPLGYASDEYSNDVIGCVVKMIKRVEEASNTISRYVYLVQPLPLVRVEDDTQCVGDLGFF
jgi:hypothetical protein